MPKAGSSKRAQAADAKAKAARENAIPEDQVMPAEGWETGADQEYELVDVDAIKEHPDNYNVGDEDAIRESMDVNGWFGAVLVQKSTGYIIAHNHAFRVAKLKGALQVPVIWKDVDDVEALRILVADNETARRSNPDRVRLDEIRETLGTLDGTGLRLEELEAEDEARSEREAAEEASKAPKEGKDDDGGDEFEQQFGVVVICADEEEQMAVYEQLKAEGRQVRPVSV